MTNDEMETFLWEQVPRVRGEHLARIGDVELDTTVRVVVQNPVTKGPMIARAEVLDRNTSLGEDSGVLTNCGRGFTEFPLDYPCLASLPPVRR